MLCGKLAMLLRVDAAKDLVRRSHRRAGERFRRENAPHRFVDPRFAQSPARHRRLHRLDRGIDVRRHQNLILPRFDGADGRLAGVEVLGDAAHVHGVADDEAVEFQLVPQQARSTIFFDVVAGIVPFCGTSDAVVPYGFSPGSGGRTGTSSSSSAGTARCPIMIDFTPASMAARNGSSSTCSSRSRDRQSESAASDASRHACRHVPENVWP